MTFPASDRVVYARNPLIQVICQLRFPPILTIAAKEPADFQERVRLAGYPFYQKTVQGVSAVPQEISMILGQFPASAGSVASVVHKFLVEDRTSEIDLTQEVVGVGTTKYLRWQQFESSIRVATQALEAVYRPGFYLRVALRYRNTIDREKLNLDETQWSELVQGHVLGLLDNQTLNGRITSIRSQAVIRLEQNQEFLSLRHGFVPLTPGRQGYAIDAEFYSNAKQSGESVFDTLGRLHGEAGNFFRWSITEKLSNALGRE
jgi:uncharacterized protein (TIGR04255 family)